MSAPPEKKRFTTISMAVESWKEGQTDQISAVQRIQGYPWRLRVFKCSLSDDEVEERVDCNCQIELICDMSKEANLWMCTAIMMSPFDHFRHSHTFKSWDQNTHYGLISISPGNRQLIHDIFKTVRLLVSVKIRVDVSGSNWTRRTIFDPLAPTDGILVIGEEKNKINVHKSFLASQSPFFDRLFFGDFKEKNMTEITINDVEYEEFSNLLHLIYGLDGSFLTDENVCNVLQLADRFDLKIVKDLCANYLLSDSTSLSIHQTLLISEQSNFPFLKNRIISRYTSRRLRVLIGSPEWEVLSKETTKALINKCCDLIDRRRSSDSDSE